MGGSTTQPSAEDLIENMVGRDIHDLNVMYLQALRQMAQQDPAGAAKQYGVPEETARRVAQMGDDEIAQSACRTVTQFSLALDVTVIQGGDDHADD